MSVIEIHPEELFDKLEQGRLTAAEGARLRAHLATCDACRFELAVRGDFRDKAAPAPTAAPTASGTTPLRRPSAPPSVRSLWPLGPRAGRSRVWIVAAAAALLLIGSGALAARYSGALRAEGDESRSPAAPSGAVSTGKRAPVRAAPAASRGVAAPFAAPPSSAVPSDPSSAVAPSQAAASGTDARHAASGTDARHAAPKPAAGWDQGDEVPGPSAASLFAAANRARAAGEGARAVSLYRSLQRQFPRSAEAEISELTLATLLLHSGDAGGALAGFEAYLGRGARGLEAEALVGRATALGALGRREAELSAWRKVAERYPGTTYGRRAAERMTVLGRR